MIPVVVEERLKLQLIGLLGVNYTFGFVDPVPRPAPTIGGWLRLVQPLLVFPNYEASLGHAGICCFQLIVISRLTFSRTLAHRVRTMEMPCHQEVVDSAGESS